MLRGNPGMVSKKFSEALEELKKSAVEYKKREKNKNSMLCEHSIVRNNNRVRRNGRKHDSFLGIDDSACRDDARLGMCIFSERQTQRAAAERAAGFASGVMVAASVWSLLIPSMDMAAGMGRLAFVPAATGMLLGMAFLLVMDRVIRICTLAHRKRRDQKPP